MEVGSVALQNELDNLASAGRVGVISLATDFNIENDLRQLFPQNVASFTSRVRNYNPLTIDNLRRMEPKIQEAADTILPGTTLDVVIYACTSGTIAIGEQRIADLIQAHHPDAKVTNPVTAALAAFGADSCPYLISGSGAGGYDSIIMGPTDRELTEGDVLIIDTGANYDGYFSDFDRNYAFGQIEEATQLVYDTVYQATEAGLIIAEPGRTTGDLWQAMWSVLEKNGALGNDVGRMGHGLGRQLTEWPSHAPNGDVILKPGMVLTLEPGMAIAANKMMVHEENIVITENGCELLHERTWKTLPVIV